VLLGVRPPTGPGGSAGNGADVHGFGGSPG